MEILTHAMSRNSSVVICECVFVCICVCVCKLKNPHTPLFVINYFENMLSYVNYDNENGVYGFK